MAYGRLGRSWMRSLRFDIVHPYRVGFNQNDEIGKENVNSDSCVAGAQRDGGASAGARVKLARARQNEQKKTWSTHRVPPPLTHSSMAFRCVSLGSVDVARPTKAPSLASAAHCLLKTLCKAHARPRWEQDFMASCSARALSFLLDDHPACISGAL